MMICSDECISVSSLNSRLHSSILTTFKTTEPAQLPILYARLLDADCQAAPVEARQALRRLGGCACSGGTDTWASLGTGQKLCPMK